MSTQEPGKREKYFVSTRDTVGAVLVLIVMIAAVALFARPPYETAFTSSDSRTFCAQATP